MKDLLRVDGNKTELLLLAQHVTRIKTKEGATTRATLEGNVLCSVDLTNLVPCSHEEGNSRLCSYMWLMVLLLRQDTGKCVLDIAHYNNIKPNELYTCPCFFGYFGLYFMHLEGATFFRRGGGGDARKKLGSHRSHTQKLREHLKTSSSCKMGSVTKQCQPWNDLWCFSFIEQVTSQRSMIVENILFTRKSRILENLPPTKAALQQHVKGVTFQASARPRH